jgi:hypothetical protein
MASSFELSLGQMGFHKPRIAFLASTILVASDALRRQSKRPPSLLSMAGFLAGMVCHGHKK